MKTKTFPERVEKFGVSATIYAPKNESKGFTVAYHVRGKVVRKVRNSYEDAKQLAQSVVEQKGNGELDILRLGNRDCYVYLRAAEAVKATGRPLDLIAHEYAEAVKLLGNDSLIEAVKFYLANRTRQVKARTVEEVLTELLENKQRNGRSKLYLTDLRLRLTRFAKSFRCPIHTVEPADIQRFLNGLKMSGRSRNNFRRAIGTLFRFARVRGYVPATHTGILEVERASGQAFEIHVFIVDELLKLLATAKEDLIPALVIGAFAGLRSEEIKRLDWADFKWEDNEIEVRAANAKTGIRRLVTICDSLKQWLMPHKKASGPVCPYVNLGNQFLKLAKKAGVQWKRNGLRHSAISYRVAAWKNIAEVAQEAGNTPTMIQRHYLRVVNRKQADAWFAVTPEVVEAWRKARNGKSPVPTPPNGNMEKVDFLRVVLVRDDSETHTEQPGRAGCRSHRNPTGRTHKGRSGRLLPGHQTNGNQLGAPIGPALCEDFTADGAVQDERH
jgi:integrase